MMRSRQGVRLSSLVGPFVALGAVAGACSTPADEGPTARRAAALSRSSWQMHDGLEGVPGLVELTCDPRPQHGNVCEYDDANIPPAADGGWGPAPDGDVINFSIPSRVCGAPGGRTCFEFADFTYFQTFVDIPAGTAVTTFTIAFNGMDDGSRVSIFNSAHPGGVVVPGSFVFLGGSGTADLAALVVSGEVNRVVITQVDDCCSENNLREARVVLNGEVVDPGCSSNAECDDGNACTDDRCLEGGDCSHGAVSCDDGDACTLDACDPASGCSNVDQCPDCGGAGPTAATVWPPNHKFVEVGVEGVTDPQGQPVTITVDAVRQDEPTDAFGDGNACPDAGGVGGPAASVRAERSGAKKVPGDGRVYHISFTATDPDGFSCTGSVTSCVPHDMGQGATCVDGGPLYDSTACE